jgi:transcriptional regulator with XRE-family HTH domain
MTVFGLLLKLSGLSQREAAAFLSVSPSQVDKMTSGARSAPPGIIAEMRELIRVQQRAADVFCDTVEDALDDMSEAASERPEGIDLGYPTDDIEARALGFPTVSAWAAAAARIIADIDCEITLVPRGSTTVTAMAADVHDDLLP